MHDSVLVAVGDTLQQLVHEILQPWEHMAVRLMQRNVDLKGRLHTEGFG